LDEMDSRLDTITVRCDNFIRMTWLYKNLIRPALFNNDAETIHARTMHGLAWASRKSFVCDAMESFMSPLAMPVEVFGLRFPNPIGLAAGMDKFGEAVPAWSAMGFGFAELGGVTWHAQPGNPKPRIFRAVSEDAIVNRMGFNNDGAEALAAKLRGWRAAGRWPRHPVGINLGKSKITPLETAAADYASSFRALHDFADFFVVNVSSPNTPNLRQLQDKFALDEIFAAIQKLNKRRIPVLVKVAPDLSFEALDEILQIVEVRQIAGIVATNTTISRPVSDDNAVQKIYSETGGLSGRPLQARSTEVIRHLAKQTRGRLPIIGVGGIFTADDAWEKITAGATLLQIYTGLVYEGPTVVKTIVNRLREKLSQHGLSHIHEAVGLHLKS
jgi:dihydroorotate dehydrogenase